MTQEQFLRLLKILEHEHVVVYPEDIRLPAYHDQRLDAVIEAVNLATKPYHDAGWARFGATLVLGEYAIQLMLRVDPDRAGDTP